MYHGSNQTLAFTGTLYMIGGVAFGIPTVVSVVVIVLLVGLALILTAVRSHRKAEKSGNR